MVFIRDLGGAGVDGPAASPPAEATQPSLSGDAIAPSRPLRGNPRLRTPATGRGAVGGSALQLLHRPRRGSTDRLGGPGAGQFAIVPIPVATLAPRASCGSRWSSTRLGGSRIGGPGGVLRRGRPKLIASGRGPPPLLLSPPASHAFGDQPSPPGRRRRSRSPSPTRGAGTLHIGSIALGGAGAGQFTIVSHTCRASVAGGEGLATITVIFDPVLAGHRLGATLRWHSDGGAAGSVPVRHRDLAAGIDRRRPGPGAGPDSQPGPAGLPARARPQAWLAATLQRPDRDDRRRGQRRDDQGNGRPRRDRRHLRRRPDPRRGRPRPHLRPRRGRSRPRRRGGDVLHGDAGDDSWPGKVAATSCMGRRRARSPRRRRRPRQAARRRRSRPLPRRSRPAAHLLTIAAHHAGPRLRAMEPLPRWERGTPAVLCVAGRIDPGHGPPPRGRRSVLIALGGGGRRCAAARGTVRGAAPHGSGSRSPPTVAPA